MKAIVVVLVLMVTGWPQDFYVENVYPVFEQHCLGCHGNGGIGEVLTGGPDSGMNFSAPSIAYQRLLMPSFGDSGATMRVVPGNPDSSSLYNKVSSDFNTVWFGDPMPPCDFVPCDYESIVEPIRQWIASGAVGLTSINDLKRNGQANLFTYRISPNRGLIYFQAKAPIVELRIYDAVGKLVREVRNMRSSLNLSTNQWRQGMYFAKITTPTDSEIQKLILH